LTITGGQDELGCYATGSSEMGILGAHRASQVEGSPASPSEVLRTMTGVGGSKYLGGSATAGIGAIVAKMTAVSFKKLQTYLDPII